MESQLLVVEELIEVTRESGDDEINELSQLHLAVIGGGSAETCPY